MVRTHFLSPLSESLVFLLTYQAEWAVHLRISVPHYVYILLCADRSLYVGYTTDLHNRKQLHDEGRGGQYTSTRLRVQLVYHESRRSLKAALERERQIKRWTRAKKEALIAADSDTLRKLSPTPRRRRK